MDHTTPQPAPQTPSTPPPQPATQSKTIHHSFIIALFFGSLFLLGLGIFGGYYFASTKKRVASQEAQKHSQISPTASQTAAQTGTLPSDWNEVLSTSCNVGIPVPPKTAPYYVLDDPKTSPESVDADGFYWIVEHHLNKNDALLSNKSVISYSNPNAGGSGFVSGAVDIFCGPNKDNLTTESFKNEYIKRYTDGTYSSPDGELKVVKQEMIPLWDKDVAAIYIEGGISNPEDPFYLLATDKHLYRIDHVSMSSIQLVKDTTNTIFKNLHFKD